MPRFSSRTLAIVQRNVGEMLTESCTIERENYTRGTMGETLHGWDTVASGIACRVIRGGQARGGVAEVVGGQETLIDEYRLIVPVGTPLNPDYRVTVGGVVYQVVRIEDSLTDAGFVGAVIKRARHGT